ncbi:acyltransferase family protein [Corynebacterium casei]|uniref:acyltransferase family protein n=1 Tax=Corynebacterium casei TaxID=160386 RepID=UPI003F923836
MITISTLPQHLPALDGIRAVAALGIVVTHVSFQTGTGWAFAERFDYFVAVFFALSAFVLWRRPLNAHYYRNRVARIAPAYLVCVIAVILLFPDARSMDIWQILTNLTSTQIYIADGLAPGLTHLWSLCVEIAFYLALPLIAFALQGLGRAQRIAAILGAAVLSYGWPWLPFVAAFDGEGINFQIWPASYISWFAVGMLAAEFEGKVKIPTWVRPIAWALATAIMWVASRKWFGPQGLVHPEPDEFNRRILAGAAFAACIVVPYALGGPSKILESPTWQFLGKISYSIFLWHVAVLGLMFPLTGISLFSGHFTIIFILTVAFTIAVSYACYELVEEPARRYFRGKKRQATAAAVRETTRSESPA